MSSFSKTLESIVSGTRNLEEFAAALLSAAIDDVLLCVSRDYGHDFTTLVETYRDRVVARHSSSSASVAVCAGTSASGKPCTKRAFVNGFCKTHATQKETEDLKRRKTMAYRHTSRKAGDPIMDALRGMSARIVPAAAYCVHTSSATTVTSLL